MPKRSKRIMIFAITFICLFSLFASCASATTLWNLITPPKPPSEAQLKAAAGLPQNNDLWSGIVSTVASWFRMHPVNINPTPPTPVPPPPPPAKKYYPSGGGGWSPPPAQVSPTQPTVTGANTVYSNQYITITARSVDAGSGSYTADKIYYRFQWDPSAEGPTRDVKLGPYDSGAICSDQFRYGNRDIGYTRHVKVTAWDGKVWSDCGFFGFKILSSAAPRTPSSNYNIPTPRLEGLSVSTYGQLPGETAPSQTSVFTQAAETGMANLDIILVIAIIICVAIAGFKLYTDRYPLEKQRRKLFRKMEETISQMAGAKPKPKYYDVRLKVGYPVRYKPRAQQNSFNNVKYQRKKAKKKVVKRGRKKWTHGKRKSR